MVVNETNIVVSNSLDKTVEPCLNRTLYFQKAENLSSITVKLPSEKCYCSGHLLLFLQRLALGKAFIPTKLIFLLRMNFTIFGLDDDQVDVSLQKTIKDLKLL